MQAAGRRDAASSVVGSVLAGRWFRPPLLFFCVLCPPRSFVSREMSFGGKPLLSARFSVCGLSYPARGHYRGRPRYTTMSSAISSETTRKQQQTTATTPLGVER